MQSLFQKTEVQTLQPSFYRDENVLSCFPVFANGLSFASSSFMILSFTEHIKCETTDRFSNMVYMSEDSSAIRRAKINTVIT
jgi:hypothetical protein